MTRFALAIVFAAAFGLSLLGSIPLGFVLVLADAESSGLAASAVSRTIWNGTVNDMRFRGVSLGDAAVWLDPLALATGKSVLRIHSGRADATIIIGRVQGVDQADATIALSELGLTLPLNGDLRLKDTTFLFENGRCSRAAGSIATDIFQRHGKGPELNGELSCDGGAAVARLSGNAADVRTSMLFRFGADGHYRLESRIAGADPSLRGALILAGFLESADGLVRIDEGNLGT